MLSWLFFPFCTVLTKLLAQLALFKLSKFGGVLVNEVSLAMRLPLFHKALIHCSIFESDGDFLSFIYFSLEKASNKLPIAYFEYSVALWSIVLPFAIVIELSLIFSKTMPHALPKFTYIDVLASH